ncbi:MAG: hypothetical protein LW819_05865, partial [Fimbriimonadaceae bacterium]|nr:hypothetical protein [Fimbriimonadaceae bacterium]
SIPDEEAVYNNRKWNLRTSINVEKVSEALSSRQGTRFLLLFANYKFQPAIDKVYEFLRVEDLFGDRLSEMADQTETLKYPDYDSLNQLEYSLQELRAERSLSTEKYIKDNNTNALLITQDLMDRRDNAEKWSKLCQVLTFIFFVSGSLLGIMNQLRIPSSAGVKEGEQGRDADC